MSTLKKTPKSNLNITFVADIIDEGKSGGVISARRLIDYLKGGHNLTVVSTGKTEEHKIVLPSFYLPFVKNIMQEMGFIFAWPKKQVLQAAFKDADLVHIQFPFLLGYRALAIAREMGKPVVLGFHVQPENLMWNIGLNYEQVTNTLYRFFVRSFYNKGDMVLSPSMIAKTMLEKNQLKAPVEVISNGLPAQFKPEKHTPDPEFKDKFVILMSGRLAKEKRHDLVISAIKQSAYTDKIQLLVTGKGPLREKLELKAKSQEVSAEFAYVSEQELIRLYNTADLLIHASEVELEGMAVLEAIGCGLPALIANAESSASSQFALNEKFLFAPGDAEDLSARIDYWFEHRDELNKAKNQYLQQAQQYGFNLSAQKTVDLYYKVLSDYE